MNNPLLWPLADLSATRRLAQRLAQVIRPPLTLALNGTLGTGKTQLVRDLVVELGGEAALVTSPTYVLQQSYRARCLIHHFDFYRLQSAAQVWDLGIDELFEQPALIVIEWAEKFPECLPEDHVTIALSQVASSQLDAELRLATLSASGPQSAELLQRLAE